MVEPRTSPLEFIDTMGGLYERARASAAAVATVYAHVRRRLLTALGLPLNTGDERLVAVAADASGVRRGGALQRRSRMRERHRPISDLTAKQAVPIVRGAPGVCGASRRRWEGAKTEMSTLEEVTGQARRELAKVIVGQAEMVDLLLLTIVCGGHALLEGVPGLAKTLAIRALARIMRLQFQRVQCTPDLMPADIVGANVFNMATSAFTLHQGPVFTDLLLVDEINRMPPRTQAALLEAMEERQVTIDGTSHRLSPAFTAFATQNPVEFEGTYPLPEAELDRFLVKIRLGYPDRAAGEEEAILERHHRGFDARAIDELSVLEPLDLEQLAAARREVQAVTVEAPLFTYIAAIARRTREWPSLTLGVSPRGAIHLMQLAKAMAAMDGREFLLPDDVKRAAPPVFRHRLILKPEADLEGLTADQITADILAAVEVPK